MATKIEQALFTPSMKKLQSLLSGIDRVNEDIREQSVAALAGRTQAVTREDMLSSWIAYDRSVNSPSLNTLERYPENAKRVYKDMLSKYLGVMRIDENAIRDSIDCGKMQRLDFYKPYEPPKEKNKSDYWMDDDEWDLL